MLRRVAATYGGCASYRDTGLMKTVFTLRGRSWTEERRFKTAFVRPDRFRFEFTEKGRRYIIWKNGEEVRTWWDLGSKGETVASLRTAIAAATGVSGSSAHTVPVLLMPDQVSGARLIDLTEPVRLSNAQQDGVECFRVQGRYAETSATIWVDKATYLIRRIDEELPQGAERSTTYDPVANGGVPENLLTFDPPPAAAGMTEQVWRWAGGAAGIVIFAGAAMYWRLKQRSRKGDAWHGVLARR